MAREQNPGDDRRAGWSESAFEATFFTYYPRLVGMLCRMLGDRGQAEELASDTLAKLASRGAPLEDYSNLPGWLYRTAGRLGIDSLRAAARRRHYETQTPTAASLRTPLDELLQSERSNLVRAVLARLKPAQAHLLILRSHGLSYKELADALQTKPSSIGTLLARAEAAFETAYSRLQPVSTGQTAAAIVAADKESR